MGGVGLACLSRKPTPFPGSSEDTGNEVGRKRHYGMHSLPREENDSKQSDGVQANVDLVHNFGVEIET